MLEKIKELHSELEFYIADGFDDAVIGIATDFTEPRLIYSVSICLDILEKEFKVSQPISKNPRIDAIDYFNYNVCGSYVGEKTPIWCWDIF